MNDVVPPGRTGHGPSLEPTDSQAREREAPLPFRRSVLGLLAANGMIAVVTLMNFATARAHFPAWFGPVFLGGMSVFVGMITFYLWGIYGAQRRPLSPRSTPTKWLWTLAILSVICTSSLHQFAPFRPDVVTAWRQLTSLRFIRYNFVLTASSLVAVIALATLSFRGHQHRASTGLLFLAGIMLVPNDDCTNAFNQPWLDWLGASPLMFLGNSVVLLVGYCGLHGIQPRASAMIMSLINAGVLVLGFGHMTGWVW